MGCSASVEVEVAPEEHYRIIEGIMAKPIIPVDKTDLRLPSTEDNVRKEWQGALRQVYTALNNRGQPIPSEKQLANVVLNQVERNRAKRKPT